MYLVAYDYMDGMAYIHDIPDGIMPFIKGEMRTEGSVGYAIPMNETELREFLINFPIIAKYNSVSRSIAELWYCGLPLICLETQTLIM